MKNKGLKKLNYEEQYAKCVQFIKNFQDYESGEIDQIYGRKKYLIKMQKVSNDEINAIEILYEDLESFFRKEDERTMLESMKINTKRYIDIFSGIILSKMPKSNKSYSSEEQMKNRLDSILKDQRMDNYSIKQSNTQNRQQIPLCAHKKFDVWIIYGMNSKLHIHTISQFNAEQIGSLVVCKAIVMRTSQVKPVIVMATYACDICGCQNYQQIKDQNYKPLTKCISKKCQENKLNGKLTFLPGHSTFVSYQQLKLQQTSDQLKQGRIPMTFRMLATGNLVKLASPGDVIFVQGILTPFRKNGFFHQYDLAFQCHLEACQIIRQKKKYVQMAITQQDKHKINVIRANTQQDVLFEKLALSIAPEIYGLQHVKKALLLLMVGGTTKQTHDYLRIRGEINLLLLGDPGIAKSQLLKHISYLSPRGIYTTGKGSSGVGLTAAIVCDPYTKQLSLEAGALVLADMGICCIDQFDKMDEHDRTAIHQVMEQQTVSIAKAGITTNLNARSSILAAANPLFGRYNIKQSIQKNINLPSALVSRFDLIFILLDNNSKLQDLKLAEHIGHVHKNGEILNSSGIYQPIFLRNYIAMSKQYQPTISKVLHEQLIAKYIAKRKQHLNNEYCGSIYTSMRHLLGLIRLCQARAKLRFSNEVSSSDVYDCLEIMDESMKMVENSANVRKIKKDSISQIYSIIKNLCMYNQDKCCKMNQLQKRIITKGYTNDELEITIKQYSNMNILLVQNDKIILIE